MAYYVDCITFQNEVCSCATVDEPAVIDRPRGVGLTPHQIAIERALAAVATVNQMIDEMG